MYSILLIENKKWKLLDHVFIMQNPKLLIYNLFIDIQLEANLVQ